MNTNLKKYRIIIVIDTMKTNFIQWKSNLLKMHLFLFTTLVIVSCSGNAGEIRMKSPDGKITAKLLAGNKLSYTVTFDETLLIDTSALGFDFLNAPSLGKSVEILSSDTKKINETWKPVWGKHSEITDHCNETVIRLKETVEPFRTFAVEFRLYNDGVAFRYFLPGNKNTEIARENTEFKFLENHTAWPSKHEIYNNSQEKFYLPEKIATIKESDIVLTPLLVKVEDKAWVAIHEAKVVDWAGMFLDGDNDKTLHAKLAPWPVDSPCLTKIDGDRYSPWRVIMIGDNPGTLIESEILNNLNDPCAIDDTSWIRPGKCAWDHWWAGGVKMENEVIKEYIDFAAYMGYPYMLIDWQWYGDFNRPEADCTTPAPQLDMPAILAYAKEKNVECWLWMASSDVSRSYEKAFPLYKSWGIAGVKIDFMDRQDQDIVNWYHKITKCAAENKLMINFHGAYRSDGFTRTYPNVVSREGVLGNEFSKWSDKVTPRHNVSLAFTRLLAGQMDYTPGGFINKTKKDFVFHSDVDNSKTFDREIWAEKANTRAHELALFVVYESPIATVCDHPKHYYGQTGLDFLKWVPTTFDDIKFLGGEPEDYVVIARHSGDEWYIGALNASSDKNREIEIKLDFLTDGKHKIDIFADTPESDIDASKISQTVQEVSAGQTLKITMANGGGWAARIR